MSCIFEGIVTTLDDDALPYHAPFGIVMKQSLVRIAPFRPSRSLNFLLARRCAVFNMTDHPLIFAGCLTGRKTFDVTPAVTIEGYGLAAAVRRLELQLEKVVENETRPELFFRICHETQGAAWEGHHRGRAAIIEACVLLSRLHILPSQQIEDTMNRLADIVQRTAGRQEKTAWRWLVAYHHQWKEKHGSVAGQCAK